MKNLKKLHYRHEDFEVADRIGKMFMRMVQPNDFCLSDRDERYFTKLKWVYPLICEGYSRNHILKMIEELDGGVWRKEAAAMFNDAQLLFARFGNINKKLLRGVARENLLGLARQVKEDFLTKEKTIQEDKIGNEIEIYEYRHDAEIVLKGVATYQKIWSDIIKLEGLDKIEEEGDDGDEGEMPDIEYEDDQEEPKALQG